MVKISVGTKKNVYSDLSKYNTDIDSHVCGFKTLNKGKLVEWLLKRDKNVDIY